MNATEQAPLLVERRERVLTLTMNRPERLNALSPDMIQMAIDTLQQAARDPEVGCVLLTGAGRGFCAGGDVTAMNAAAGSAPPSLEAQVDRQRHIHRFAGLLRALPKVTIAAINGPCAGAGFGLALACDLRIAAEGAKLTTAFAKVGFSGDFGITWPLVRIVGEAKALELLLLSEVLSAEQAQRLGLVNRVVSDAELQGAAADLAARIASGPVVAFRYMKENVRCASTESYESLLDREALTQRRCAETADHKEGAAAFVEKRAARFVGR